MSGKIYVVGLGPGGLEYLTPRAIEAITISEVVIGYKVYINLIRDILSHKTIIKSGMKQEIDRVEKAFQMAKKGKKVALVSSGDAGVYGMAGPVCEMAEREDVEVEVIPGITAVLAAAAGLGAPLMHDFAIISLSDLLTPWEKILKRLHAAGEGDFIVGLYNPRSKRRKNHLRKAQEILLKYRSPDTPVGIVWKGTRYGEKKLITRLDDIPHEKVNMFATLIIGNSETYIADGRIVTPRGYNNK